MEQLVLNIQKVQSWKYELNEALVSSVHAIVSKDVTGKEKEP